MNLRHDTSAPVVGGEPRIDFLPPEIKARKQAKKTRRSLAALVILVAALCGTGFVLSFGLATKSQELLEDEQQQTQLLLQEQLQYAETRSTSRLLTLTEDARLVAASTEILWRKYLIDVQGILPTGVSISTFSVDSLSATDARPVLSVPLQEPRVATLSFTAISPEFGGIEALLVNVRGLTGFADGTVSGIVLEDGHYAATVTVNINSDAFEKRFSTAAESQDASTEEEE